MSGVRIIVADDHEIVRKGLRAILEEQPGWSVIAEAATGRQAVHEALRIKPDIVILDISMPELNGLEAARQILKDAPEIHVLVLTMHESEHLIREVLQVGARGYLLKTDAGRDLVSAVEALRQGRTFFTHKVTQLVLDGFLKSSGNPPSGLQTAVRLTPREREIIQLLAEGGSNKDVASQLNISVKTVETHRANIMEKLDLHSLSDLVRYAIRNQIIES